MISVTKKAATTTAGKNSKSWTQDKEANLAFILATRRHPDLSNKIESAIVAKIELQSVQAKIDKLFEKLETKRDRVIADSLMSSYSELVFFILGCGSYGEEYLKTSDKHIKVKARRTELVLDSLDLEGKIKFESAVALMKETGGRLDSMGIESKKLAKLLIEKKSAAEKLDEEKKGLEDICSYLR